MAKNEQLKEIVSLIKYREKINQGEIAASIGVTSQYFSDVLNGRCPFNDELREKIYEHYSYTKHKEEGNGNVFSDVSSIKPYISDELISVQFVPINAVASFVENLYGIEYDMEDYGVLPEQNENLKDGTYIVFQIERDSMSPTILPNSKILCRRIENEKWEYAQGIVVIVYGKTLTVKRIVENRLYQSNQLVLKGDNPMSEKRTVERAEIRGMWKAIRIVSQNLL